MTESIVNKKIMVLGSTGLLGSAIVQRLLERGCNPRHITMVDSNSDLTQSGKMREEIRKSRPEVIFHCAGLVGGIVMNQAQKVNLLLKNTLMTANVIGEAWVEGIEELYYMGSSCIYPPNNDWKNIKEDTLLTAPPEKTNEGYALAKIIGLKMCEYINEQKRYGMANYKAFNVCNLYGKQDKFHTKNGHLVGTLVAKIYEAKKKNENSITLLGDGTPVREFMYAPDAARAIIHMVENSDKMGHYCNIGIGEGLPVMAIAQAVASASGWYGDIVFDGNKEMNGMQYKVTDVSVLRNAGYDMQYTPFHKGMKEVVEFYEDKIKDTERFLNNIGTI